MKHPGLHLRELSRNLQIPKSSLLHHLNYLEKRELIVAKYENRYMRFFVSYKFGTKDKKYLSLIRHNVIRNIILIMCLKDISSQIEIVKNLKKGFNLNKHPTTVAFHLNKLEKMGVIERFQCGNETKYMLNDRGSFIDLFTIHEKSYFDYKLVNQFLIWMDNVPKDYIDHLTDRIFQIFPHPYYA